VSDPSARLQSLYVRDFRNLAYVKLEPPSEGLVVVGDNGQGKTNFLEAIYYLEILRSSRGARDQDLVRFGSDGFHVAATLQNGGARDIAVGFERAGKRKRVRLDGGVPQRLSDAVGALPAVIFSPTDIELIAGAPTARRRYLDIMLALTSRGYLDALQRYRGALARRNAALRDVGRTARATDALIEIWDAPLAEHGARLWTERETWVTRLAPHFATVCRAIGEQAPVTLRYATNLRPGSDPRSDLATALEEQRGADICRGATHAGPHRDDLAITLDGRDLRAFGSAGQQRTAAIALRMLEVETFREHRGGPPLFLLDDPFAELDVQRSARIMALLDDAGLGQTFLAVPRETDIPSGMGRLARYRILAGDLHPWGNA
jgi:DNA replication and repair protein RecF